MNRCRNTFIPKLLRKSKNNYPEQRKRYTTFFCNPGCKKTQFQEAPYTSRELEQMYSWAGNDKKQLIREFKRAHTRYRKSMKNSFYTPGFPNKTRKRLQKQGALSGCVVGL